MCVCALVHACMIFVIRVHSCLVSFSDFESVTGCVCVGVIVIECVCVCVCVPVCVTVCVRARMGVCV